MLHYPPEIELKYRMKLITILSRLTLALDMTKILYVAACLDWQIQINRIWYVAVSCAVWFMLVQIEESRDGWEQLRLWGHWVQPVSHTYCAACLECRRKPGAHMSFRWLSSLTWWSQIHSRNGIKLGSSSSMRRFVPCSVGINGMFDWQPLVLEDLCR